MSAKDSYTVTVGGTKFDIPTRYTQLTHLGEGAYGCVCGAHDEVLQEGVAIKKIIGTFERLTFTKRTLRELRILRHLKHENVMCIRGIFLPNEKATFQDIYVFSDLMETDLWTILRSSQELTDDHKQFFLYQILRGLKFIHSARIIHRDLKPRNLIVDANCELKICDFGLARLDFAGVEDFAALSPMTEYVCTRWYRAPELLCAMKVYTAAIDMWSVGCIFAEMVGRKPLWSGTSTQNQLELVVETLGAPPPSEMANITNEPCRQFVEELGNPPVKPWEQIFPDVDGDTRHLLGFLLRYDTQGRATAEQALAAPYMAPLHEPSDEPSRGPVELSEFEFERRKISAEVIREELYREMLEYDTERRVHYQVSPAARASDCRLLEVGETQCSSEEGTDTEDEAVVRR
mmetsp:Transcript_47452/g.125608  ORF Transcript_47452/g.125608 Transcript_47452/m.125608 type:complete len:404 (+) Transcript_47452:67-1278(+)